MSAPIANVSLQPGVRDEAENHDLILVEVSTIFILRSIQQI